MTQHKINPNVHYPNPLVARLGLLKQFVDHPQIEIGEFTYYDDPNGITNFIDNIHYLFDFIGDRLIIGKYCQIATGVNFIMNGGNHSMSGFSTYPFGIFGGDWSDYGMSGNIKGDTIVGNDVWIGRNATILCGIKIGNGAIIASHSVVTKDVEPYTIVGGNPARVIRKRFDDETIEILQRLAWWNIPPETLTPHLQALTQGDINYLTQWMETKEQQRHD